MPNTTQTIVKQLFDTLGSGAAPATIAALFSENVDWDIPGDVTNVPWIGKQIGRQGVAAFYQQIREQLESIRFDIHDTLVGGDRAVVLGQLASRVKRTGKVIHSEFAFDLTVQNAQITRFRMFEDSFAVAQAML